MALLNVAPPQQGSKPSKLERAATWLGLFTGAADTGMGALKLFGGKKEK